MLLCTNSNSFSYYLKEFYQRLIERGIGTKSNLPSFDNYDPSQLQKLLQRLQALISNYTDI